MSADAMKRLAAQAAIAYVEDDAVVGIGTGSTANHFIDLLAEIKHRIDGAVASSEESARRLRDHGIRVYELNSTGDLSLYVDGADEATRHLHLIKGGGGALTREKIVAAASRQFVCIADESKLVDRLGEFPLPIEVIPMARSYVARQIVKLGGNPELRESAPGEAFVTDNGNLVLDVLNLEIMDPAARELEINQIAGVVTVGLFAQRPADVLILGCASGDTEVLKR